MGAHLSGTGLAHKSGQLSRGNESRDIVQEPPLASIGHCDRVLEVLPREDVGHSGRSDNLHARLVGGAGDLLVAGAIVGCGGAVCVSLFLIGRVRSVEGVGLGSALEERRAGSERSARIELGENPVGGDEGNAECANDTEVLRVAPSVRCKHMKMRNCLPSTDDRTYNRSSARRSGCH